MRAIILAVVALCACQGADAKEARALDERDQDPLAVGSKVSDLLIVATSRLPNNTNPVPVPEYCEAYAIAKPKTPGGKRVAAYGWIVTSETRLGNYEVVTFVAVLDPMTSGTCVHIDGNMAVFDGLRLKAIAFEPRPPANGDPADLAIVDSLGVAEQIDPRKVRLYWGLPSPPFADVVLRDGIFIENIAKEDKACGGITKVPNIFGETILNARRKLRSYGWLPSKPEEKETGGEVLFRQGVIEVEACSGTGFGFCAYNYKHKNGVGLRVISVGEEYRVSSYEAFCPSPTKRQARP